MPFQIPSLTRIPTTPFTGKQSPSSGPPICQQHEFECSMIPMAELFGWKQEIDFKVVERRVRSMHKALQALIDNAELRELNPFWQKAIQLKNQGLAGDINTFHLFQTGYYGEQGLQIISNTLPRVLIFPDNIHPLTSAQFVAFVLIPEVAACLVMEDMGPGADKTQAIGRMMDSSAYGALMFPAGDS
ncbi:RTC4 domain-containing protein [Mycena venus]|uniref:Restriction of telomere capping protein 4 n=1 Tax=Mycena venus TaxID=2733690 RepID=A0A8H7D6J7_9AGAR|nr:RTC4 domain-containing protein [Mycena venus]